MKKYKKRYNMIFIISILIIALLFSVSGIIVNLKSHTYTSVIDKEFSYEVDASSVALYSTLKDNETFIENYGSREVNLNYGKNILPIQIIKNNRTTDEYFINITRKDTRESESRLSSLVVSNNELNFDKDKYTYSISVGNDVNTINVNATLLSSTAHFIQGYGPRKIELQNGLNVAMIKVKSEAGTEKYYKINIFKNADKESNYKYNDDLESLSVSCGAINFDSQKTEYKITTKEEKTEIYAFASSNDVEVQIEGDTNLSLGDNNFKIKVIKDNTVLKEYLLNIIREDINISEEEKTQLQDLKIGGFNINFKPNVYEYNISLKSDMNLIVSAFPKSKDATVSVIESKNILQILVSNNENSQMYTINISKNWFTKPKEIVLQFIVFIIALLIVINVKFIEFRVKKRGNRNKKKK